MLQIVLWLGIWWLKVGQLLLLIDILLPLIDDHVDVDILSRLNHLKDELKRVPICILLRNILSYLLPNDIVQISPRAFNVWPSIKLFLLVHLQLDQMLIKVEAGLIILLGFVNLRFFTLGIS